MIRRLGAAAMALGAMLAATALTSPAFAGDAPVTSLPLGAGGVTYQECTWSDGASPSHFTICALMKGWDYTNNTTHSWSVDGNGLGHVSLDALSATAFPNGFPTKEANSSAIAANTAPAGIGVTQLVPNTGTTSAPVPIGAPPPGARFVRIYPETGPGSSVPVPWTRATSAANAASQFAAGAYNTVSMATTGPNWDESISLTAGTNIYVGAVSGAATFDFQ